MIYCFGSSDDRKGRSGHSKYSGVLVVGGMCAKPSHGIDEDDDGQASPSCSWVLGFVPGPLARSWHAVSEGASLVWH